MYQVSKASQQVYYLKKLYTLRSFRRRLAIKLKISELSDVGGTVGCAELSPDPHPTGVGVAVVLPQPNPDPITVNVGRGAGVAPQPDGTGATAMHSSTHAEALGRHNDGDGVAVV